MLVDEPPFSPFNETLRNILRTKYITQAAQWLLGKNENTILVQEGNSAWEAALTILFLADVRDILTDSDEEPQLRETICRKSILAVKWLISIKKVVSPIDSNVCWEYATYDTSVIIRALLVARKKYENHFDSATKRDIIEVTVSSMNWLKKRFSEWETLVKYPFGPADVAQIVITTLYIADEYPEVYQRVCQEWGNDSLVPDIVEYLLYKKAEKITIYETADGSKEQISGYFWEDNFNTAEVVEALAIFYKYCQSSISRLKKYMNLLQPVKTAITRSCTYFEQGQVEGMWGSHLETIRVLFAYVSVRNLVYRKERGISNPLIVPEMQATFKALRWICDKKQVLSDGSFIHTPMLTIFYAHTLVEVYCSWEHAYDTMEKIYDDVVWFSHNRTTPERSKRLATEMRNNQLEDELDRMGKESLDHLVAYQQVRSNLVKLITTIFLCLVGLSLFMLIGNLTGIFDFEIIFHILRLSDFLQYLAVAITVFIALLTLAWGYDKLLLNNKSKD